MSDESDYGVARENVLEEAHERVRTMALRGLSAVEIEGAIDRDLTATERELLHGLVKREVFRARHLRASGASAAAESETPPRIRSWRTPPKIPSLGIDPRPWRKAALIALPALLLGVLLGVALTSGGGERRTSSAPAKRIAKSVPPPIDTRPARPRRAPARHLRPRRQPPASASAAPAPPPVPSPPPVPAGPAALNDRGFQLMNQGRYRDAIPMLQRAVAASTHSSADLTNAYALYNLGRSLRLAGRAREAIPLLERRLKVNDQRATVAKELRAARRAARAKH